MYRYKMHQAKSEPGEQLFETMKDSSVLLRRIIMIPSLIATWVLGVVLIGLNPGVFQLKFMWVKLSKKTATEKPECRFAHGRVSVHVYRECLHRC